MKLLLAILTCFLSLSAFTEDRATGLTQSVIKQNEEIKIPANCPECRVRLKKIPIVYGLPSPKLVKQAEKGKVLLGGCINSGENFAFVCPKCKAIIAKCRIEK